MNKGTKALALVAALAAILMLPALPAGAQDKQSANMEIVREAIQANKKLLIAQNMGLTESEANAFWPVYDRYQEALGKINERKAKLIADYAKEYQTLSDQKGQQLLEETLAIEEEMIKLKKSYLSKFNPVLPAKKVARYYQLENKIQALIGFDLANRIPLVK